MSMPEQKYQENNTESNTESRHVELSEQYYKSRKQLMLYSGLFFVYEFIGIKVPTKPIPNSDLELLSPKAVPIVLLILVIYFLYRSYIGWKLSNDDIKAMKVSKQDYYPSIAVAIISILLFAYQSISKVRIADLDIIAITVMMLAFLFSFSIIVIIGRIRMNMKQYAENIIIALIRALPIHILIVLFSTGGLISLIILYGIYYVFYLGIGFVLSIPFLYLMKSWARENKNAL